MARIQTLDDFRGYLKLTIGQPVINVEVADAQYDQLIEDAVQDFQRYTYGEAVYRDVLTISLSAGVSAYQLDESIDSILDISLSFNNNGINDLFTPQHNLLYNDWVNGNYPGGPGGTGGTAGLGGSCVMGNYDVAMVYLKEIEDHFSRKYTCDFNPNSYIVRIWPTPNVDSLAMLTVYKKETAINLYNNPLLKKLARARVELLWGKILRKYSLTLPGGGGINAEGIINDAKADEEKAIESIRLETEPAIFMIG
jgi:hypothetical protein